MRLGSAVFILGKCSAVSENMLIFTWSCVRRGLSVQLFDLLWRGVSVGN